MEACFKYYSTTFLQLIKRSSSRFLGKEEPRRRVTSIRSQDREENSPNSAPVAQPTGRNPFPPSAGNPPLGPA